MVLVYRDFYLLNYFLINSYEAYGRPVNLRYLGNKETKNPMWCHGRECEQAVVSSQHSTR